MTGEIELIGKGPIKVIKINRPEARNALNIAAQEQFTETVFKLERDGETRVIIITAAGDQAFAAGGDLKELHGKSDENTGRRLNVLMGSTLEKLTRMNQPIIAAVNGDCIGGGCEIITACDLRIAVPHARFRFAQIHMALTTGWGGAPRLVRLLGQARAADLLMTGRSVNAQEATTIGLIHRTADSGQDVLDAAMEWAEEVLHLPGNALSAVKQLINYASEASLPAAYRLEQELFTRLWSEPDHIEAVSAFMEKRKPKFA